MEFLQYLWYYKNHSKFIINKPNISKEEVLSIDFRDLLGTYWVYLEAENVFGFGDTVCKDVKNYFETLTPPRNVFAPSK